ncbi:MAG: replication initiator protein [Microviridae sp.]|nr:MAG: replication initiator protein [Microviridae sp.]
MPMTIKGERLFVPCQKCNFCLQNKRNEWAFRISYETKRAKTADFLTFTYDEENLPLADLKPNQYSKQELTYAILVKSDLALLMKSLKQKQARWIKDNPAYRLKVKEWKIKYYAVGEYGTKRNRPHYHAIVFNILPQILKNIKDVWPYGIVHRGDVNADSIGYTAKYVIDRKKDTDFTDPRPKPFALISKGIGEQYIAKRGKWNRDGKRLYVTAADGIKVRLPRYYKDKIFNQEERNELGKKAAEEQEEVQLKKVEELARQNGSWEKGVKAYNERIKHAHDSIKSKSLKQNKL